MNESGTLGPWPNCKCSKTEELKWSCSDLKAFHRPVPIGKTIWRVQQDKCKFVSLLSHTDWLSAIQNGQVAVKSFSTLPVLNFNPCLKLFGLKSNT